MSEPTYSTFAAKLHDVADRIDSLQQDLIDSPELRRSIIRLNPVTHLQLMFDGAAHAEALRKMARGLEKIKPVA